jgi:magnesium transporter
MASGIRGNLDHSILTCVRQDAATLGEGLSVQQAVEVIRQADIGEKIVYFYVLDDDRRLTGVVSARRLLTARPDQRLAEVMARNVVAIPDAATLLEACDHFARHKLLAFPVVDDGQRMVGVVDVGMFTEDLIDIARRERMEEVFESIGFRVSQVRGASALRAFRFRFPWLLATIVSGTGCAVLVGLFEFTLAKCLVLAFFLTLALGLGESVSIQSMTVTIHALRAFRPTWAWYWRTLRRELGTAVLLGLASGLMVGLIVWGWRGEGMVALAIGGSLVLSLSVACFLGLSIPALLHTLRLDPKIAAGPLTLALADLFTILCYFTLAAVLL